MDIPWLGGLKCNGRGFDIPWVGIKIQWVGGSILHGYGVRYTMGNEVEIPWVVKIRGSIYHGYGGQNIDHRAPTQKIKLQN